MRSARGSVPQPAGGREFGGEEETFGQKDGRRLKGQEGAIVESAVLYDISRGA